MTDTRPPRPPRPRCTPPAPEPRQCCIQDCVRYEGVRFICREKNGRWGWTWSRERFCQAHKGRISRLGTALGRKCYRCKTVAVDLHDETHAVSNRGQWFCTACLGRCIVCREIVDTVRVCRTQVCDACLPAYDRAARARHKRRS